jgi:hypothetical protein
MIQEIIKDQVSSEIDLLADLCKIWSKYRKEGETPLRLKHTILDVAQDIITQEAMCPSFKCYTIPDKADNNEPRKGH